MDILWLNLIKGAGMTTLETCTFGVHFWLWAMVFILHLINHISIHALHAYLPKVCKRHICKCLASKLPFKQYCCSSQICMDNTQDKSSAGENHAYWLPFCLHNCKIVFSRSPRACSIVVSRWRVMCSSLEAVGYAEISTVDRCSRSDHRCRHVDHR